MGDRSFYSRSNGTNRQQLNIYVGLFFGGSRVSGDKMQRISAVNLNDVCVQEVVS